MSVGWALRACAVVVLSASSPAASEEARGRVASTWQTIYGRLDLESSADGTVRGRYGDADGTVVGSVTPEGVVTAYWIEERRGRRCRRAERDRWYWGFVVWRIHPDGRLTGRWSFCDEPLGSAGPWQGTLVAGTTPLATLGDAAAAGTGPHAGPRPGPSGPPAPAPADVTWEEASAHLRVRLGDRPVLDDPERLRVDFTCDGGLDVVTGWAEPDIAGRRGFRLLVVHRRDGALVVDEAELPLDGDPARPTTCRGVSATMLGQRAERGMLGQRAGRGTLGQRAGRGMLDVRPLAGGAAALRDLPPRCGTRLGVRDPLCGGGFDLYWSGAGILFEPATENVGGR